MTLIIRTSFSGRATFYDKTVIRDCVADTRINNYSTSYYGFVYIWMIDVESIFRHVIFLHKNIGMNHLNNNFLYYLSFSSLRFTIENMFEPNTSTFPTYVYYKNIVLIKMMLWCSCALPKTMNNWTNDNKKHCCFLT